MLRKKDSLTLQQYVGFSTVGGECNLVIDLHAHTNLSDGELSPTQLVERAAANGVTVLSITDHDTVAVYDKISLRQTAKSLGIAIIPGVEVSTVDKTGRKWHMLGHYINPHDVRLRHWLEALKKNRYSYATDLIDKLEALGWHVDKADVLQRDIISKAHIADAVIGSPSNNERLLREFDESIPSRGTFIEAVMNRGCPAYIPRVASPTPAEAIDVIKAAGGTCTLAHPIAAIYEQNLSISEIEDVAASLDLDGIESYYYYYSKSRGDTLHNKVKDFVQVARQLNIVSTGGSDFHGTSAAIGKFIDIGMVGVRNTMSMDELRSLAVRRGQLKNNHAV